MDLFTARERTDPRPLRYPETHYEFYDRAAGPFWDDFRTLIETWFARLLIASQPDVRSRLQSKDRRQVDGAFWELYLHELFHRLGFMVDFQPELIRAGAPPLTPDLRLQRDGETVYVEAVVVLDSDEEDRKGRRHIELVDAINDRVQSPDFDVILEIEREGPSHPPLGAITKDLQRWLDTLDPERVLAIQHATRSLDQPTQVCVRGDWHLRFGVIAKVPGERGLTNDRVVGIYPSRSRNEESFAAARVIRESLNKKARKYEIVDAPYVVALLVRRSFASERDVRGALYGGTGIDADLLRTGRIDPSWASEWNGFWATRDGPKHRNVSAVLYAGHFEPAKTATVAPMLWLSPWAERPLTVDLPFAVMQADSEAGLLRYEAASQSPADIFGLSTPWPPDDPFASARVR